ncbi:putative nucleic acid-binding protein [Lupinus albus]|uniref:Putative nucleic acid-binding protein n=1 Tax=Lupinus albus TaxID=3870 RepID=A0A6A4PKX2_LUPAL|nr:putative nucleic acid-binding protein [Lupinus albus]
MPIVEIIGVVEYKSIFSQTETKLKKVTFDLIDFCGDIITCNLWHSLAMKFINYYKKRRNGEPMIILLTNAKVKKAKGDCPTIVSSSWCGSKLLIGEEINDIAKYKQRFSSLPLWFDQFSEGQCQLPSPQPPLSKWEKRKSHANDSQQLKTAVSFTAEHDPDHLEVITSSKRMWGELDLDLAQSPLQSSSGISSSNVAKHMKTK